MVWFIAGIVLSWEKSLQKSVAKEEKGKPMPLFSITSDKSNICWRKKDEFVLSHQCLNAEYWTLFTGMQVKNVLCYISLHFIGIWKYPVH